jgi:hypothetical protein
MNRYKKTGFLLCMIYGLIMQGCVRNDLEDCPEAVSYSLAFRYMLHTDDYDRFYNDVDKLFVYVFDSETETCVYADTVTMLAPFGNDYTYPLPVNVGNYNIITWGWGRNSGDLTLKRNSAVIPTVIPGQTTINEARFLLEEKLIDGRLEKTFYGERRNVEVSAFISRTDTVPLMNIMNQIRLVMPEANTAAKQNKITVSITGNNGAYRFKSGNNAPNIDASKGFVTYVPYAIYRTDSILKVDPINLSKPYTGSGRDSMLIVEISTLRLVVGSDLNLVLLFDMDNQVEIPLIDLIVEKLQTGFSSNEIQYNMDKYYRWQITYDYTNTSTSASVDILDWSSIEHDVEVGGNY